MGDEARRRYSNVGPARHFLETNLQALPALPDCYDVIWIQWVLLYLTDSDLVAFLRHAWNAVQPYGYIVVKENCLLGCSRGLVDERDASMTRSDKRFRELFGEAGLHVAKSLSQQEWPANLLPVM